MKTLYFDCTRGVSGDMLLSSMLGTGVAMNELTDELHKLGLTSYELILREKQVGNVSTLNIDVRQTKDEPLRHYTDIVKIIEQSGLDEKVKKKSLEVLKTLQEAGVRTRHPLSPIRP